jgi:hypothetical protein
MTLEVALLEEEEAAWTLLPHAPGSTAAAAVGDVVRHALARACSNTRILHAAAAHFY